MAKKLTLKEWILSANDQLRPDGKTGHGAISDLADEVGVGRTYMSRIVNGRAVPSLELAKKISKATRGTVSAATILGL